MHLPEVPVGLAVSKTLVQPLEDAQGQQETYLNRSLEAPLVVAAVDRSDQAVERGSFVEIRSKLLSRSAFWRRVMGLPGESTSHPWSIVTLVLEAG